MPELGNFTYDEISIGQTARYSKLVEERDVKLFAAVSGDVNPVHLDADFAAGTPFGEPIAHGMLTGAIISAALAMELPGPGTVYLSQSLKFRLPVKPGDTITVALEVTGKQGIGLKADELIYEVDAGSFDALFLPGGPAVMSLRTDGRAAELAKQFAAEGKLVAAICAARRSWRSLLRRLNLSRRLMKAIRSSRAFSPSAWRPVMFSTSK